MDWKTLAYMVVVLWSVLITTGGNCARLSRKQDLELEKQLKLLNKPSVKTIKTKYGDIYDCVDFYQQPAFDHPLLKNHDYHPEMRPNVPSQWRAKPITPPRFSTQANSMKLKDGGCPNGTVPIKRVTKDYLIRMRRFTKQYASSVKRNGTPQEQPLPITYLSVIQSKSDPGTLDYKGIGGSLSVYNLSVGPSQYSASELILKEGNDTIKVGLMVNPSLNNDNLTRMFQYVDAGDSHCFDTICPGFVSMRSDIPINAVIEPISTIGGPIFEYKFFVFQDIRNGNWWLEVENLGYVIGFWPPTIFTGLAKSASYIAVGGEAYTPPEQPLPPMGNGLYPNCQRDNLTVSGFCRSFIAVDASYDVVDDPSDTQVYSNSDAYAASDLGYISNWGRLVCFGGPNSTT